MAKHAENTEKQAATVHFRNGEYHVSVAPPGNRDQAISAAAKIASKRGRSDVAADMVNNRDQCYVKWGEITLTKTHPANADLFPPEQKPEPSPPKTPEKLMFPDKKISGQEIFKHKAGMRKRVKRH